MTRESKIICKDHFKQTDVSSIKEEFNKKMALLICRSENLAFKGDGKADVTARNKTP
jgi:hypothetical protein